MSKKALITTLSVVLVAIALVGLSVGIAFAAGAWRVDDIIQGVETEMDSWNAAIKDMEFDTILDENGNAVAYKLVAYKGSMNAIVVPSVYNPLTYGKEGVELPVTTIGSKFARLNGIAVITLPSSVTTLEDNALMGFKHLKHIKFNGNGLTKIGRNVLNGCNQLNSVWLPKSVATIGDNALSQCNTLKFIDFEGADGSVTVGKNALSRNAITNGGCKVSYNVKEGVTHD